MCKICDRAYEPDFRETEDSQTLRLLHGWTTKHGDSVFSLVPGRLVPGRKYWRPNYDSPKYDRWLGVWIRNPPKIYSD